MDTRAAVEREIRLCHLHTRSMEVVAREERQTVLRRRRTATRRNPELAAKTAPLRCILWIRIRVLAVGPAVTRCRRTPALRPTLLWAEVAPISSLHLPRAAAALRRRRRGSGPRVASNSLLPLPEEVFPISRLSPADSLLPRPNTPSCPVSVIRNLR